MKGLTAELAGHPVTAVGVTPGWLRSEKMLADFGVTEENWRDACVKEPGFAISESPAYVDPRRFRLPRPGAAAVSRDLQRPGPVRPTHDGVAELSLLTLSSLNESRPETNGDWPVPPLHRRFGRLNYV